MVLDEHDKDVHVKSALEVGGWDEVWFIDGETKV